MLRNRVGSRKINLADHPFFAGKSQSLAGKFGAYGLQHDGTHRRRWEYPTRASRPAARRLPPSASSPMPLADQHTYLNKRFWGKWQQVHSKFELPPETFYLTDLVEFELDIGNLLCGPTPPPPPPPSTGFSKTLPKFQATDRHRLKHTRHVLRVPHGCHHFLRCHRRLATAAVFSPSPASRYSPAQYRPPRQLKSAIIARGNGLRQPPTATAAHLKGSGPLGRMVKMADRVFPFEPSDILWQKTVKTRLGEEEDEIDGVGKGDGLRHFRRRRLGLPLVMGLVVKENFLLAERCISLSEFHTADIESFCVLCRHDRDHGRAQSS
ncbi:branched-chain amino acid aminotransferase [Striga asiatica]|uniref:Branched-chain amino acid aminotransferase n=1 Tax=Striga asiatica TaxID=4170 RepID=A0A5A7PB09_STRAF|nr:branched-chain amino acid aminotransferase [Striga asiatica]